MKRIISCIIAVAMMLSIVGVSASASAECTVSANYDAVTSKVTITGTFPGNNSDIAVVVSKRDYVDNGVNKTIDSYDDLTKANVSGLVVQMASWNGEGALVLPITVTADDIGYYIVFCSVQGSNTVPSTEFYVTNQDEQQTAINAFKTASADTIGSVITTYSVDKPIVSLDLNNPIYISNTQDVQTAFANCIAEEAARLESLSPAGEFGFESITESFNKALALADFNSASDKAAKVDAYKTLLGLTVSTDGENHKAQAAELMSGQSEAINGKILSQSAFITTFNKGVAICVINASTRETIKNNLLTYDDIIGIDAEAGYEAANEDMLNGAMTFRTIPFAKTEEIAQVFGQAVVDNPKTSEGGDGVLDNNNQQQGGIFGGGGGGGQTTVARPTTSPESETTPVVTENVFTDVSEYSWAHDAIKYLSKNGVLQGVGGGKFEPARSIKREEYAKIMVEAFELSAKGSEKTFSDVAQDAWYCEYVNVAYENGLITGVSDTEFGAGSFVTRQDAAVILYRYLKSIGYEFTEIGSDFDDIDECAEYAKEAIRALKNSGLINGSGNNCFTPDQPLNRAQAAVMVYNIMNGKEAK